MYHKIKSMQTNIDLTLKAPLGAAAKLSGDKVTKCSSSLDEPTDRERTRSVGDRHQQQHHCWSSRQGSSAKWMVLRLFVTGEPPANLIPNYIQTSQSPANLNESWLCRRQHRQQNTNCWRRQPDNKLLATYCCDWRHNKSTAHNQSDKCQQPQRSCLANKHLSCADERLRGIIAPSDQHNTIMMINNTLDCDNRWQAHHCKPSCLAYGARYDTNTLFTNKDAPQADSDRIHKLSRSISITSNNNNNNTNSNNYYLIQPIHNTGSYDNLSYVPSIASSTSSLEQRTQPQTSPQELYTSSSIAADESSLDAQQSSHSFSHLSAQFARQNMNTTLDTGQVDQFLYQAQPKDPQTLEDDNHSSVPMSYPNNTLIVDLNKCHHNLASLWSKAAPLSLTELRSRWPAIYHARNQTARRQKKRSNNKSQSLNFLMPVQLLKANVKLKSQDYDKALSVLTSDVRYQLHLLLYKRIQTLWILLSTVFCMVAPVVFTNLESIMVIGACSLWLVLQVIGVFSSKLLREKLDQMLEKSVAQVNTFFLDHNLMLGVINVGSLFSKSKLMVPMLYFDMTQCRKHIESIISIDSRNHTDGNTDKHILDYTKIDMPLTKPDVMSLAQSQLAKKIVLRYSQRWISYFEGRKLMFNDDHVQPRHLSTGKCLCQFIEEHFGVSRTKTKHNQPVISSYTKANLVWSGKEKITAVVNNNKSTIPTLSEDITSNERVVDLVKKSKLSPQLHSKPNGLIYINHNKSSIPTDVRLEIGNDDISRSDDIIKKLRLLLELRKNELQNIDGSLFAGMLHRVPQQFPTLDTSPSFECRDIQSNDVVIPMTHSKKFFNQKDGLLFFGTNGAKTKLPNSCQSSFVSTSKNSSLGYSDSFRRYV